MSRKLRTQAISIFQISSESFKIKVEDWTTRKPHAVWYGIPVEAPCAHPSGGTVVRAVTQAIREDGQILGYLAMPRRYAAAWTQLCYSIVYWLCIWEAWLAEQGRPRRLATQPKDLIQLCIDNAGARLMKYLHIRRLIIDELLQHSFSKDGRDVLDVFDEYLIRDRFDLLWTEYSDIPDRDMEYLIIDPVHPSNAGIFCEAP
jgi:hypothetical protein